MKIIFAFLLAFICVLHANIQAFADSKTDDKALIDPDKTFEDSCTKTCIKDYTKIASCDTNEMVSEYILEMGKDN